MERNGALLIPYRGLWVGLAKLARICSKASQPTMRSSTVNCFMPRVCQTLFPLQNHAKIGGVYGHTHLIFEWKIQSSPYFYFLFFINFYHLHYRYTPVRKVLAQRKVL